MFNTNIQLYDSDDFSHMKEINFLDSGNTFFEKISIKAKLSPLDVYDLINHHFSTDINFNFFARNFFITDNKTLMIRVFYDTNFSKNDGSSETPSGQYEFYIWCTDRNRVSLISEDIKEKLNPYRTSSVNWSFTTLSGEIHKKEIFLEKSEPLVKSFYPWLPTDTVQDYFREYLSSPESILLLTGIPGTGKTTFIRSLILENNLNADLTYDEKLMNSDEFFLRFIDDAEKDILVIEDADHLLYDRDESQNNILAKILNISDGIIKNVTKKIVFSTNITDIDRIDPALIRPGRCYDVLDFRKLTFEESKQVLIDKGINRTLDERSYTLAELFSTNKRSQKFRNRKFGF